MDGWDPEDHPRSVLSGRTNDEVKADPDRLWRSDLPAAEASVALRPPTVPPPTEDELAALDELGSGGTWEVFGRSLRLTNLDKELLPGPAGRAGGDQAGLRPVRRPDRPDRAALPGRPGAQPAPLPERRDDEGLLAQAAARPRAGLAAALGQRRGQGGRHHHYLVVDEPAALVWAANFGALEWHAWTSRTDEPHQPTYALIDIDPGATTSWDDILALARLHRTALEHLGVRAQPKVTGRRGIQIWVPIARGPDFAETRAWVEQLSKAVGGVVPELVSWKWNVRDRGGQARLDYTQNAINKTLVAPYSPRPAPGAPVSAPIDWDELDDPALRPDGVTIRTVLDRLAERGDPFRTVLATDQHLPPLH